MVWAVGTGKYLKANPNMGVDNNRKLVKIDVYYFSYNLIMSRLLLCWCDCLGWVDILFVMLRLAWLPATLEVAVTWLSLMRPQPSGHLVRK